MWSTAIRAHLIAAEEAVPTLDEAFANLIPVFRLVVAVFVEFVRYVFVDVA